jgi:hypothetical protein
VVRCHGNAVCLVFLHVRLMIGWQTVSD